MAQIRIGISGWTYAPWRGTFFPRGLPQKRELAYAAAHVPTIEINGTFYSMQRPSSFGTWYEQTPENFIFAIKGPRFITHLKRLKDVVAPTANFFASGVLRLNEKLGPILWQLPPQTRFDPDRLAAFFNLLPRSTREAAVLGRHHDHRLKAKAWLQTNADQPLRHALEVRHPSFETAEFVELLRRHDIGLVVADTAGRWPLLKDVTSDFVYVRLHGDEELYASGYSAEALKRWAAMIRAWHAGRDVPRAKLHGSPGRTETAGRDVYVYFDNDVKTHAPYDAMRLAQLLGLRDEVPPGPPPPLHGRYEAVRTTWNGWPSRGRPARGNDALSPDQRKPSSAAKPSMKGSS